MMTPPRSLLVASHLLAFPLLKILAQETSRDWTAVPSGDEEWRPSEALPGAFYAPLVGDGTKPGVYVYRIKVPDGALLPPHWHSQTMHATVLSGTLFMVMGAPFDSSRARRLPPGSFLITPARMQHMEWFQGETVIHVETRGPLKTTFLNPADDPRRATHP